jgi:hypothetical protein
MGGKFESQFKGNDKPDVNGGEPNCRGKLPLTAEMPAI